ncbi:homocysteine S-methyltransferase family protein [Bacteroidota bacterium]
MKILKKFGELNRPLILDGALGSLLQERRLINSNILWSATANIEYPEKLLEIHRSYIEAGAEIITTNTFRTNPYTIEKSSFNLSSKFLVDEGVSIAKKAVGNKSIIIAGSNAPAEDCYQRNRTVSKLALEKNHHQHIDYLMQSGVDLIWNETFSHMDEIDIVCNYCNKNDFPFIINLFVTKNLNILSGEEARLIIKKILKYYPIAIGFNCMFLREFKNLFKILDFDFNWGFYLNCGSGIQTDTKFVQGLNPKEYLYNIRSFINNKLLFVGSCCGSNPDFTKVIRDYIYECN